jgi:Flp pilus assembly protein TadD
VLTSQEASGAPAGSGAHVKARTRRGLGGRRFVIACALAAFALSLSVPHAARAQIGGGAGDGHVIYGDFKVDESKAGGMVPISFVLILMTDTGSVVERQSVMNDTHYRFSGLGNGNYDLVVESAGMPVARLRVQLFGQSRVNYKQDILLEWEGGSGNRAPTKKGTVSTADNYERTPANRALFDKAAGAIAKKKFDEAAALLKKIVEADPKDHLAWTDLGTMHYALGNTAEAERAYVRALAVRPDLLAAAVNLGRLRLAAKNYEQAVEALKPAVEKHPISADAQQLLGEAYLMTGKHEEAAAHFAEALRLDPDGKADAHVRLAMIYDAAGRKDLAADQLEEFIGKRPASPERQKFELYVKQNKKQ